MPDHVHQRPTGDWTLRICRSHVNDYGDPEDPNEFRAVIDAAAATLRDAAAWLEDRHA